MTPLTPRGPAADGKPCTWNGGEGSAPVSIAIHD